MPPKRTRSAAQEPDGNSSNVTDYLGPYESKRLKRGNQTANSSGPATRGAAAVINQRFKPQQKAAPTRRQRRERRVDPVEDDDDEGSIHVNFPQISSVVNEARQGRLRTVNGLHSDENREGISHGTAANQDLEAENEGSDQDLEDREGGEDQEEEEDQDDGEDEGEEIQVNPTFEVPKPPRRGRPPKPKQHAQPSQQARMENRTQAAAGASRHDPHEFQPNPPAQTLRSQQRTATRNGALEEPQAPRRRERRGRPRNQDKSAAPSEPVAPVQIDEQDAEASDSEEEDGQDDEGHAVNDSAFIEAPPLGQYKKLQEVHTTINSLGGIEATLGNAAWTGLGKRALKFEARCKSSMGRVLMEIADELHDIFVEAIDARNNVGSAEGAYEATIAYLSDQNGNIKRQFAGITELLGKICTEGLAPGENMAGPVVRARKRLLRDIARRLIPMFVLLIRQACNIVPSTPARGMIHFTFTSFTLQFPLRIIGWTERLEQALTRGLELWPIDAEFAKEGELDEEEFKLKRGKTEARSIFRRQLWALFSKVKETERTVPHLVRQAAQQKHQEENQRNKDIQQRQLWDAEQRQKFEDDQRKAKQHEAFCISTQALNNRPDPMKQLWDQAEEARRKLCEDRQAAVSNGSTQGRAHDPRANGWAVSQGVRFDDDDDPFVSNPDQNARSSGQQNGLSTSNHSARPFQARPPPTASYARNGPDWTREEEKILIKSIRGTQDYDPDVMAGRLNRSRIDVSTKAVSLKTKYREIYAERGDVIPEWAL